MSEEARYTDRQVALILKRAATLQAHGDEERHSLADIRQIALQVGIPAELVDRAALEIGGPGTGSNAGTSCYATSSLPVVVHPRDYPALISVIRRIVKEPGQPGEISGALEWSYTGTSTTMAVTVAPGPRETTIRVEGEYQGQKSLVYLVAGITTLITTVFATAGGNLLFAVGVAGAVGLLTFSGARLLWKRMARSARHQVDRVRDALADAITTGASAPMRPPDA